MSTLMTLTVSYSLTDKP